MNKPLPYSIRVRGNLTPQTILDCGYNNYILANFYYDSPLGVLRVDSMHSDNYSADTIIKLSDKNGNRFYGELPIVSHLENVFLDMQEMKKNLLEFAAEFKKILEKHWQDFGSATAFEATIWNELTTFQISMASKESRDTYWPGIVEMHRVLVDDDDYANQDRRIKVLIRNMANILLMVMSANLVTYQSLDDTITFTEELNV
jgi:hypothetical protein